MENGAFVGAMLFRALCRSLLRAKSGIDMGRNLLRRSHVLVVCGHTVTESMKNDIAVAQRLGITSTTLEGILTVKRQGHR